MTTTARPDTTTATTAAPPLGRTTPRPPRDRSDRPRRGARGTGRLDWSSWPRYDAATTGLRGYWYPVTWASKVTDTPTALTLCGNKITLVREGSDIFALADRCPHRGVPLSLGSKQFPGTLSCAYHGWTYGLSDGVLKAVITDGPDSPICGKVNVRTYPVEQRLGLVWVYVGSPGQEPPPLDDQLPEELVHNPVTVGGRIDPRTGNWRFAVENGYDEGHAKYLHRTSTWRLFKTMPTWNVTRIVERGRWIYRVQDEVHWEADFPGLGTWSNKRWWKKKPPPGDTPQIGNTGGSKAPDPVIAAQEFPGFASLALPGILRIAYPTFIHYEFYVPVDADHHLYVGLMADFRSGLGAAKFRAKYLAAVRWLFHGEFSGQDAWMVDVCDAPPERLYRPDLSLTAWRKMVEQGPPDPPEPAMAAAGLPASKRPEAGPGPSPAVRADAAQDPSATTASSPVNAGRSAAAAVQGPAGP